jgi:hypothetical protein
MKPIAKDQTFRKARLRYLGLPLLLACMFVETVAADSMRCGRKVIRTGDSPAMLIDRCGEPLYRGRGYAELDVGDGKRQVKVERWHYKQTERALERVVLVYRGEIVGMETGRR